MKKVTVEVDSNTGQVSFEIEGVPGPACERELKDLEQALGGRVVEHRKTREYHQSVRTTIKR